MSATSTPPPPPRASSTTAAPAPGSTPAAPPPATAPRPAPTTAPGAPAVGNDADDGHGAGHDDDLADLLRQITEEEAYSPPAVGDALTEPTDVERPQRADAARIQSEGGIDFHPDFASFGSRFVGLLVDTLVLLVCLLPGVASIVIGSTPIVLLGVVVAVAGFVGATVWYARSVADTGQWFGNRLMSTKVVDARNGQLVTVAAAATRYLIRTLVSPILLIGFLVALGNSERQAFHDSFAGTVVTRPPRASWSIDDEDADA